MNAKAPMRLGGKAKETTPVPRAGKPAPPRGTAALKKAAKASKRPRDT